ncbi:MULTISPECIES: MATE family efflux transporter [Vibrio]|uniref:lipopolysaccharide biosynthesis protein n=1 Tax=Vibrio TaxID=662 RepID=UPI000C842EF4|nr:MULTISPECIES: MATE family efflux transporter [Vibrio]MCF7504176.1 oligosaccharide flippase family protein [Vibrio sp. L3-7]PMN78476.1 hypothetical protein BCT24_04645 [Vibrio splendidus]TVU75424.1 oligosaccharide flippase family protein [Vibrio tasmaniensis]
MKKIHINNFFILGGKIYTVILSIALLPILLEHLGSEQYGLIGSFVVLQTCIQVLDAGVSGTLTRQSIITQKNYFSFFEFVKKAKVVLLFFVIVALIVAVLGFEISGRYADKWFNSTLEPSLLSYSATLMFFITAARFLQGPFRSILLSYESHKLLAIIDMVYATINGPLIVFCLLKFDGDITYYFNFQLFAVLGVLFFVMLCTWNLTDKKLKTLESLPSNNDGIIETSLNKVLRFGFRLSILSMLWVVVNQSDKLVLTKYMPLSEYAFYAIAISLIAVLSIFSSTMVQTVRPRFTHFFSEKNHKEMSTLLRSTIISLTTILTPLVIFLIVFGHVVIEVWTGDPKVADQVMNYFPYLLVGSYFVALSEISFILLYASGDLKSHTRFYTLASMVIIPLNIYIASEFLGLGSSKLFMLINIFIFMVWSSYNIRKFFYGALKLLLMSGVISAIISIIIVSALSSLLVKWSASTLFIPVVLGMVSVALSYLVMTNCISKTTIKYRSYN